MTDETRDAAAEIRMVASKHGIEMRAAFVPFSQSRNAKPSPLDPDGKVWRGLNWRVTLSRRGRDFLECDYAAGVAHTPAHKAGAKRFPAKADLERAIAHEIEKGTRARPGMGGTPYDSRQPIPGPEIADVLHSLAMDSAVLDEAKFEDWAEGLGYSTDSRAALAIYRECLKHALALRANLGETGLQELRDAAADY